MKGSQINTKSLLDNQYNNTSNTTQKRHWVVPLYGCLDNPRCFPLFCPIAVCFTPNIIGQTFSRLNDEEPKFCSLGNDGLCLCCLNIAVMFTGPCGGSIFFGAESVALRKTIVQKYNIDDDYDSNCCGSSTLGSIHLMCSYPCSLFQMVVTLEEFQNQAKVQKIKMMTQEPSVEKGINI